MTEEVARVVALRGAVVAGQPVPSVVAVLESLLERARTGQVRAVAYAVASVDGTVATGWEKPDEGGAVGRAFENHALASGIMTLAVRYGSACDGR
jgi:hypothetical protein